MGKTVKMVMVTELNNNKYYNLFEQNDGTFKVEYGRVDSTTQHASYPMSQWDTKYREKLKKATRTLLSFMPLKMMVKKMILLLKSIITLFRMTFMLKLLLKIYNDTLNIQ